MDYQKLTIECEEKCREVFSSIDEITFFNSEKVLRAFQQNRVSLRHFAATTGYGYDDTGRDTLGKIFAGVFGAQEAIVSPLIVSGTHAITLVLFGLLRPGDVMLSVTGNPYDTLMEVILGQGNGSLKEFGIKFEKTELTEKGYIDKESVIRALREKPKMVFIQRSRGYGWRKALSIDQIGEVISLVKEYSPSSLTVVDNCYGEFVEKREPTEVGADVIVGSLIKNPGGGLAPTGGYIAGKSQAVKLIADRLTSPGIGAEVGSYCGGYQYFYQGFFTAPHTVGQALKGSALFGCVFEQLGYEVMPSYKDASGDIVRAIKFDTDAQLVAFCQAIQKCSPVDSYVVPYPWDMPGYGHQVIMAAGTFVQGASIELSADSPIKSPYIAYIQGGLTYEHIKLALKQCLETLFEGR